MKDYNFSAKDCSYDISKKLNKNKNFSQIGRRNTGKGINKTEAKLGKTLGNQFKYTGNGTKIIDGKVPDFVNEIEKVIVEMYGSYWHRNETTQKTIERINLFKSHGYSTVIIWENEVDPVTVKKKLGALWLSRILENQKQKLKTK